MTKQQARLMFICAVVIYGTIGPFVRFINAPSDVVVLIRGLMGTLTIATSFVIRRQALDVSGIKTNAALLVATGLFLGLNWVFLFAAYKFTSIAIASLCNYTAPIVVVVLSTILFKEKLTPLKVACVIAAFVGIVLVSGVIGADLSSFDPAGIGLGMLSALCFVGIVICNHYVGEVDTYSRVLVQLGSATCVALVYVLINHGFIPLPTDAQSWAFSLMLGVIHTGIAYILWFGAQGFLPLQEIALLGYIEPVLSVILSSLVLSEPLSALGMIGAVLVLGAAATSELID